MEKKDADMGQEFHVETERQRKEAEFHDQWATSIRVEDIVIDAGFESPSATENKYILSFFGDVADKTLLDLGCGMGDASVYFAGKGAHVDSIDISPGMVDVVKRSAVLRKVSDRIHARQMPAETLDFPDETFDLVYGNGVLHHVDYQRAIQEVYRVLKPGGVAAFIEPLSYNPVIWVYRLIARDVRSEDEHPLWIKDVKAICTPNSARNWQSFRYCQFHLFTLLIMVWFFIAEGIHPSKERYWKRFVEQGWRYERAFRFLDGLDRMLFRLMPILSWLSWDTVMILKK